VESDTRKDWGCCQLPLGDDPLRVTLSPGIVELFVKEHETGIVRVCIDRFAKVASTATDVSDGGEIRFTVPYAGLDL
jgi:hypothetical protein